MVTQKHTDKSTDKISLRHDKLEGGLYIVATPIGNARDITLRALDVLRHADKVLCEDTRVTSKLFSLHGLTTRLTAYHEHNAEKMRPVILQALHDGEAVALVSDAGTPLISDPGYRLVRACRDEGLEVRAVPGVSAPIAALSIAGLPSDKFMFVGFLSAKKTQRRKALESHQNIPATLMLFESAKRLTGLLTDINDIMGARPVAICRELTKKFEQVLSGTAAELLAIYERDGTPKGEITVLIHPPTENMDEWNAAEVEASLRTALADMHTREAANLVAAQSGWSRRGVYQLALQISAKHKTKAGDT